MLSTILTNSNYYYTGQLRLEDPDGTKHNITASYSHDGHWKTATTAGVMECGVGGKVYLTNSWSSNVVAKPHRDEGHQQTVYPTSFNGFLISLL